MPRSGAVRMLLATVSFSLMAVLVKALSPRFSPFELVFYRCSLPLPALFWLARRRGVSLRPQNAKLVALRSGSGLVSLLLSFWALERLPLATSAFISKAQPTMVALLSPFVLGERPSRGTLGAIACALVGVTLILQPSLAFGNLAGLATLVASFTSAVSHLTVRRLSSEDDPVVIVFDFTALAALACAPVFLFHATAPTALDLLGFLGLAIFSTAGQLLMTAAYAVEEAPSVAAVSYTSALFAVFWDWLFWGDTPGPLVWLGGALLVAAGLVLVRLSARRSLARTLDAAV
jgi:drug/metabolite transporter (DMT)-like permease